MIFFKKKKPAAKPVAKLAAKPAPAPKPKAAPVVTAHHERVLTAEGWHRRTAAAKKAKP